MRGNRFRIVVRDLAQGEAVRFAGTLRAVAERGFPNYYDDQRFGSLRGTGGSFVARALLAGDDEEALRLAVAPAREDRAGPRRRRLAVRDRWGAWAELAAELDDSPERRVCARLAAGGSFREAYDELDLSLRAIHLAAYQAHVFNACLRALAGDGPAHDGVAGAYVFGDCPAVRIPLASGGAAPHGGLDAVLAAEGVDRTALGRFPFRGGERDAVCVPGELSVVAPAADELSAGRLCVAFACTLPPGSYATMLIKRASV
jgi:tRNA pseudouridine13 synthase